jgi:hypothetical protein
MHRCIRGLLHAALANASLGSAAAEMQRTGLGFATAQPQCLDYRKRLNLSNNRTRGHLEQDPQSFTRLRPH